jgi:hypothetical protein
LRTVHAAQIDPEANVGGAQPYDAHDEAARQAEREYQPYVDRAVALARAAPEWEQHWILGSAAIFADDDRSGLEHMAAVFAVNRLNFALNNTIVLTRRLVDRAATSAEAAAIVELGRRTIPADRWPSCCGWLEWRPQYLAWRSGDIDAVRAAVDRAVANLRVNRQQPSPAAGYLALAIGRLRDANALIQGAAHGAGEAGRQLDLLAVAEARDDDEAIRRLAVTLPLRGDFTRPSRLLRAGLRHEAEELLRTPAPTTSVGPSMFRVGQGQLFSLDGRFDAAVPLLRDGMRGLVASGYREYYDACAALGMGYRERRRIADAVAVLDECAAAPPPYTDSSLLFRGVWQWMMLRLDLADGYRATGRVAEAVRIEKDLRNRLRFADEDNLLSRRLAASRW